MVEEETIGTTPFAVTVDYSYFTADAVLARLLPDGVPVVTSFETVGHIAHLNLQEVHAPHRALIGQVILDKNPKLRTVVTKSHEIDNTFRNFPMEVIAGEVDFAAEVVESGCRFRFDFDKVYWNSRLSTEHRRLISTYVTKASVVADMFAGVGPFAVPAAKGGCVVHANDLNPHSHAACVANKALNHVPDHLLHNYNMDARDFIRRLIADGVAFTDVIMNLPATATAFLDVFVGAFPAGPESPWRTGAVLPVIHCYCFSRAADMLADAVTMVEAVIGTSLAPDEVVDVYDVRDVAPRKHMICVSFRLPDRVAFAADGGADDAARLERKRTHSDGDEAGDDAADETGDDDPEPSAKRPKVVAESTVAGGESDAGVGTSETTPA